MAWLAPASESPIYEMIGVGYSNARRADARVEAQIHRALGHIDGGLLNVGAGAGSYEPKVGAVVVGISGITRLPRDTVDMAIGRLADDLADGIWAERHRDLTAQSEIDGGYRLVISP